MGRVFRLFLLVLIFLAPARLFGEETLQPPEGGFRLPVSCELGRNCWIVNYFDTVTGPRALDFTCHARTYDGHDGTDIAIAAGAKMDVRASAGGRVVGVRDGEPDGVYDTDREAVKGKECGNGVRIDHGTGWSTQYCHLRQGSIRVRPGQQVDVGTVLGEVGQSGKAQFPHVHLTIRRNDVAVDPFNGRPVGQCAQVGPSLWDPGSRIEYQPFALFSVVFADHLPQDREALSVPPVLPPDPAALIAWASVYGTDLGDEIRMRILGPTGSVLAEQTRRIDGPKAYWTMSLGRKRPPTGWPAGEYRVEAQVERRGQGEPMIQRRQATVRLP